MFGRWHVLREASSACIASFPFSRSAKASARRPNARHASNAPTLSAREREIVDYLALGYTNGEIARACGTSIHTVRNQRSRLYKKLEVSTRAELVGLLRQ